MTRRDLAKAIGKRETAIRRYEACTKYVPDKILSRMASALKTEPHWLMYPGRVMMNVNDPFGTRIRNKTAQDNGRQHDELAPEEKDEILEQFRKLQITPEQKQKLKADIASGRVTALAVDRPAYADILSQKKGTEP